METVPANFVSRLGYNCFRYTNESSCTLNVSFYTSSATIPITISTLNLKLLNTASCLLGNVCMA
jgi:hypothetical protein